MTVSTRYLPLASVAGMLLIAGCGGGSGSASAPEPALPPVAFDLPGGELGLVPTGDAPLEIAAGATVRRGNVEFMCAAGGEACVVKIMSAAGDDSTRTAAYEGTGGKVAARAAREDITTQGDHGVTGTVTVSAGAAATSGNVNIACPAGGMGCTVVVEGGAVKYLATGGAPVLTAARGDVTAPGNHGVTGTVTVSAGAAVRNGNVDIACPAGGASCTVVVEGGAVKYLTTGGAPVLTAALERLAVSDDHGLDTSGGAPITIAAGDKETRGNVDISCPAGGAACVVHVINAAGVGGVGYEATGGMPVITRLGMDLALPTGNHGLTKGARIPVRAGASVRPEESNINITCPAGGQDCVVYVASDGDSATYLPKGGAPTAAAAWDPFVDGERKPKAPAGHGLASVEIAKDDEQRTHYGPRGVHLMCPTGAMCSIAVGDDGAVTYKATGGTPTVMTDEMTLAANSGPNRKLSSDGGHAVGLVTRIGTTNMRDKPRTENTDEGKGLQAAVRRIGDIVQSTIESPPEVVTTASFPAAADDPNLGITLGRDAFGAFAQTLPDPAVKIDDSTLSRMKATPAEGWNRVVLKEDPGDDAGGTVVYAAVYSDIQKSTPERTGPPIVGAARTVNYDLSLPGDREEGEFASPPESMRPKLDDDGKLTFGVSLIGGAGVVTIRTKRSLQGEAGRDLFVGETENKFSDTRDGYNLEQRAAIEAGIESDTPDDTVLLQCVSGTGGTGFCSISSDGRKVAGVWDIVDQAPGRKTEGKDDNHYLTLGVWMALPEIADGRFDVGAFADGSVPFEDRAALNALTGEAKYEGPAVGGYARGVYARPTGSAAGREGNPPVASAQVGSFDATAKLTANFGAAGDAPSVTGSVGAFKRRENGKPLGDWSVQLDTAKPATDTAVLLNGATSGEADGRLLSGRWGAEFFKSGFDTPETHAHPGYVAGTFSASTEDENTPQDLNALHIFGAFGAERQPPQ